MVGLEDPRQITGVADVVRLPFETLVLPAESDGEGFEGFGIDLVCQGEQPAGVDPPAQEESHGHVADHLAPNRLREQLAKLSAQLADISQRTVVLKLQLVESPRLEAVGLARQDVPGRQGSHGLKQRAWLGAIAVANVS